MAQTSQKRKLALIFSIVCIDLIGFGMIIPILPHYALDYAASDFTAGALMAMYSLFQFIFNPFWGSLSDRIGRRPVLLISMAGMFFSMLGLAFATELWHLFACRILAGIFAANISTAMAYVADITDRSERTKGMGIVGAGFGVGFLLGPILGGVSKHLGGYLLVGLVVASLIFINLILIYFRLEEPQAKKSQSKISFLQLDQFLNRRLIWFYGVYFLITLAMAQIEIGFVFYVRKIFELDALQSGAILSGMALILGLMQGLFVRKHGHRLGEERLVFLGLFVMVGALVLSVFQTNLITFVMGVMLYAVGYSLAHPCLMSLISRNADQENQGETLGVSQSLGSLARLLGPIFVTLLMPIDSSWPFWAAAIIMAVCVLALFLKKTFKNGRPLNG